METDHESRLLIRAKAGDARAFEEALTPHLPLLFAYTRAICGDYHKAKDVVQETAIIAFRKLEHLIPEADFGAWLRAIARREALQARKRSGRERLILDEVIEVVCESVSTDLGALRDRALTDCLDGLGGRAGSAVRAHYFEGRATDQIAVALGMTGAAVRQLLHRARMALRECIEKRLAASEAGP